MRLNWMKFSRPLAAAVLLLPLAALPAIAQRTAGDPNPGETFKDTSMLKLPAGVKVAIIEWQDLMCPACAHAFPIVHGAIAHYKIPLYEKDFTLPGHASFGNMEGAVWARYLEDKVSPEVADQYRGFIFSSQGGISSKSDMESFTRRFFQTHGLKLPFVADPTGELTKEVLADKALGVKLGIQYTPCVIVVTQHEWVHVTDVSQLYQTIDQELAKAGADAKPASAKKATH